MQVLTVGFDHECDFYAEIVENSVEGLSGYIFAQGRRAGWRLNTPARHFVYAGLFAVASGVWAGLDLESAAATLASFEFPVGRLKIFSQDQLTIVDDTYNASPEAMIGALHSLISMKDGRRIAVLGEMRELGKFSDQCHENVGRVAASAASDLITVGAGGEIIAKAAQAAGLDAAHVWSVDSATDALGIVQELCTTGEETTILAKGARFTHMERVILGLKGADVRCMRSRCTKYINCSHCPLLEVV